MWRRALEEPAPPDSKAMIPRRQTRRVQLESRLSRQCATKCLSTREHRRSFRSKTNCFSQLFEMFRVHFVPLEKSLDVASRQTRLLKTELRGTGERWRRAPQSNG